MLSDPVAAGELQQACEATIVPHGLFTFKQECQAFVKGQRGEIGLATLIVERRGHAEQLERVQGREGLFDQYTVSGVRENDTSVVS